MNKSFLEDKLYGNSYKKNPKQNNFNLQANSNGNPRNEQIYVPLLVSKEYIQAVLNKQIILKEQDQTNNNNKIQNKQQDNKVIENNQDQKNGSNCLLIKKIPTLCNENIILTFLEQFGKVEDFNLNKNIYNSQYLGYGQIKYLESDSVNKVLQLQHSQGGCINIPQTNYNLEFENLNNQFNYMNNQITIENVYETSILDEKEVLQKQEEIQSILTFAKSQLVQKKIGNEINIKVDFNKYQKNFKVEIYFTFKKNEDEEQIFNTFKDCIFYNFLYSDRQTLPFIQFSHSTSSPKNLIFIGLQKNIKSRMLSEWIEINLQIKVDQKQIIFQNKNPQKKSTAVIYLNDEEEGNEILSKIGKVQNKDEIFEKYNKVTINLSPQEMQNVRQKVQNTQLYHPKKQYNQRNSKK